MLWRFGLGLQQGLHCRTACQVVAVVAPAGNHLVGPRDGFQNGSVIGGANGVLCRAHIAGVRGAVSKDIAHTKRPEAQRAGAALAALDCGVVLHLGGGAGVEHQEQHFSALRLPNAGEGVAVALAVGIGRLGGGVALLVGSGNHALSFTAWGKRVKP